MFCMGSSPLARGLLRTQENGGSARRIIPARAGFTSEGVPAHGRSPDHPRSRGVYVHESRPSASHAGSSPLARGLRVHGARGRRPLGIIPARAGFTSVVPVTHNLLRDHPRSRGVYRRLLLG